MINKNKCSASNAWHAHQFICIKKNAPRILSASSGKMHVHDVGFSGESLPVCVSTFSYRCTFKTGNETGPNAIIPMQLLLLFHEYTRIYQSIVVPCFSLSRILCFSFDFDECGYIWPATQIQFKTKTKEKISVHKQNMHRSTEQTQYNCIHSTNWRQTKLVGGIIRVWFSFIWFPLCEQYTWWVCVMMNVPYVRFIVKVDALQIECIALTFPVERSYLPQYRRQK